MFAVRFLRPLRAPIAAVFSCPPGRATPSFGKSDFFKAWIKLEAVNSQELCTLAKSSFKSIALRKPCEYAHKLRDSGVIYTIVELYSSTEILKTVGFAHKSQDASFRSEIRLCVVLLGQLSFGRRFLILTVWKEWVNFVSRVIGFHPLADYPQKISTDSPSREKADGIIALIRKLIVPFFLVLNLWLNWGQSHPFFLVAKVTLVFLTTKPSPSSVYLAVDRLRHQIMSQQPFLHRFKPPQAKTVEVEDYTFLCLARVEIKDKKLVLIGILGGWWILPLSYSSHKEVLLFDKSWKELASLVKSRFRDSC